MASPENPAQPLSSCAQRLLTLSSHSLLPIVYARAYIAIKAEAMGSPLTLVLQATSIRIADSTTVLLLMHKDS